ITCHPHRRLVVGVMRLARRGRVLLDLRLRDHAPRARTNNNISCSTTFFHARALLVSRNARIASPTDEGSLATEPAGVVARNGCGDVAGRAAAGSCSAAYLAAKVAAHCDGGNAFIIAMNA